MKTFRVQSFALSLMIFLLTACAGASSTATEPIATRTERIATATASATTPPTATFTPTPTAFPWPAQPITIENIGSLAEINRWGLGTVRSFTTVVGENLLAFTTLGEYLYSPDYSLINHFSGTSLSRLNQEKDLFIQATTAGNINIISLQDGQTVFTIDRTGLDPVINLLLFPDGSKLAVGSLDTSIEIYSTADWTLQQTLFHVDVAPIPYYAFLTPDQQYLVASNGQDLGIWDLEKGTLEARIPNAGRLPSEPFNQYAQMLTLDYPNVVVVWQLPSMKVIQSIRTGLEYVSGASFDSSGDNIIINQDSSDQQIRRTSDGLSITAEQAGINLENEAPTEAATPSSDKTAKVLWDLETLGHLSNLSQLRVGDQSFFAIAGSEGHLSEYSFPAFSQQTMDNPSRLSSDETARISCNEGELSIFNFETGVELMLDTCEYQTADVSLSANLLAELDGHLVNLLDLSNGEVVNTLRWHEGDVYQAAFSSAGTRLVTFDGDVAVWALGDNLTRLFSLTGDTSSLAVTFSSNDEYLFALDNGDFFISPYGKLRTWRLTTGEQLRTISFNSFGLEEVSLSSLAISPDDTLAVVGDDRGQIIGIDLLAGEIIAVIPGHRGNVSNLAFSADGSYLVSLGSDGTVRLWGIGN